MTHITSPINPTNKLNSFLECKDYTVSNELFTLLLDQKSDLLITSPQPNLQDLPKYYESTAYISHTDANKSFFDKMYQFAKNYAIKKKLKMIASLVHSKTKSILDVGCGTGEFLLACQNNNWNVTGIEPNNQARTLAQKKLKASPLFSDIENLDKETKFDVITLWHVLEHIPNLEDYISILKNHLKPQGSFVIAVPNYKSYDAHHYGKFWAAYDVPRHLWHFSQKAIKLLFSKIDMQVKKTIPMKLDSFYVSLLSEKYKNRKSKPLTAFFIGLKSNWNAKRTKEYSSLIYILKNSKY